MPKILRENMWVRVYEVEGGSYTDSKYRTYECDLGATDFLREWSAANAELRDDLKAAFEWLPDNDQAKEIITAIETVDPDQASQLTSRRAAQGQSERFRRLLAMLFEEANATDRLKERFVGENPWFSAYVNPTGFYFERMPKPTDTLAYDEYRALYQSATSRAYRDAINVIFGFAPSKMADYETYRRVYRVP
jgi:hypothetical protein